MLLCLLVSECWTKKSDERVVSQTDAASWLPPAVGHHDLSQSVLIDCIRGGSESDLFRLYSVFVCPQLISHIQHFCFWSRQIILQPHSSYDWRCSMFTFLDESMSLSDSEGTS